MGGHSSSTRGIFGGGKSSGTDYINVIEYITIASTGDVTDFGDLLAGNRNFMSTSSHTRGLFAGGNAGGAIVDVIQYITIASTGNATDFGDLSAANLKVQLLYLQHTGDYFNVVQTNDRQHNLRNKSRT